MKFYSLKKKHDGSETSGSSKTVDYLDVNYIHSFQTRNMLISTFYYDAKVKTFRPRLRGTRDKRPLGGTRTGAGVPAAPRV